MTTGVSSASAGGAGGAAGVGFQDRVFAWAAAPLIAEQPLLVPLVAGIVVQVGAQTGYEVDDVVVITDQGNAALFQAKIKLTLSAREGSPLAEGLDQAARQYLSGYIPVDGAPGRPLASDRDAVVLVSDPGAPSTVRVDLADAIRRTASQPPGTVLGFELTKKELAALTVALGHVRRSWLEHNGGIAATDDDLRVFLKGLHVLVLDLDDGRGDQQAAVSVLARGLARQTQGPGAWPAVVAESHAASEVREWRDRAAFVVALSTAGVDVNVAHRYATDVGILRERSLTNLAVLQSEARLPVADGLYIPRSIAKTLRDLTFRRPVLVVGEAGSGKSAVLQDLATVRRQSEEVVVLLANDVAGINRLTLAVPLLELLRGWAGPPGLVVIDGVDALRGSGDRETLSNLVAGLAGTRWQVAASARLFDTRNSQPLRRAFRGAPVTSDIASTDTSLEDVSHLLVADLADADLDEHIAAPSPLATLVTNAAPDLRQLLRNPFNLRLAAELADVLAATQQAELLTVQNRTELLNKYWQWRVRDEDGIAREALLKRLVKLMVEDRRLQVEQQEPAVTASDGAIVDALLSHGVLTSSDGPIAGFTRIVGFSHNILFDYAVAAYVLYRPLDPNSVANALQADPSLPLVARPSFDLLIDMLWPDRSTGAFWDMVLSVAATDHVLASLAFASRIVNLPLGPDDLDALAPPNPSSRTFRVGVERRRPTRASGQPIGPADTASRQQLVAQLVGAVRSEVVSPDLNDSVVTALSHLARALAGNAKHSFTDGALAFDLINALQSRRPTVPAVSSTDGPTDDTAGASTVNPDTGADGSKDQPEPNTPNHGAAQRGEAIALVLDACRTDVMPRERLAGAIARHLKHVIGTSEPVRAAVGRLLDDSDALNQWGGTFTTWMPRAALATLGADPDLAIRLAVTSVTFEETRDETIGLGTGQVLQLNESRRQQAQHASYDLTRRFEQFCADDIVSATMIVCAITRHQPSGPPTRSTLADDATRWPVAAAGETGHLRPGHGFGLSEYRHRDEQKMIAALASALPAADIESVTQVLRLLVAEVREGWVWGALLQRPTDASALMKTLFPCFQSGTLLAHPETFTYAATLLKATVRDATVPHSKLEQAVLNAVSLAEKNGRSSRKDVLVGCLDPAALTDAGLIAHLTSLGHDPLPIPEPTTIAAESVPWSPIDHLIDEDGVGVTSEVETAARALKQAITDFDESKPRPSNVIDSLVAAFDQARSIIEPTAHVALRFSVVDAAGKLAREPSIDPDHPIAAVLVEILEQATHSPDAGEFLS